MRVVLLGAPGAGKGTQSDILSRLYHIPAISTGHLLREAMRNETPVGLKAKEYVESGRLVPDDVVLGIVEERLSQDDCKNGYILDGVPRTIPQAQALEDSEFAIDAVVAIEIADEVIIGRMAGRRICKNCSATFHVDSNPPKIEGRCDRCGGELFIRNDDAPETVKARLQVYYNETEPLKDFYEKLGKLRVVKNQPTVEKMTQAVLQALGLQ